MFCGNGFPVIVVLQGIQQIGADHPVKIRFREFPLFLPFPAVKFILSLNVQGIDGTDFRKQPHRLEESCILRRLLDLVKQGKLSVFLRNTHCPSIIKITLFVLIGQCHAGQLPAPSQHQQAHGSCRFLLCFRLFLLLP